jgi:hypothetical protein
MRQGIGSRGSGSGISKELWDPDAPVATIKLSIETTRFQPKLSLPAKQLNEQKAIRSFLPAGASVHYFNLRSPPDMEITQGSECAPNNTTQGEMTPWLGSQIQKILDRIYEKYKDVDDGSVATYIPELGKANPKSF